MITYDFSRSFLTFGINLGKQAPITLSNASPRQVNNARIQLECCCQVTHRQSGVTTLYVLGASCKTELVGVTEGVWTQPNADFCLVASTEDFLILKSWQKNNMGVKRHPETLGVQPERQIGKVRDAWVRFQIDPRRVEGRVLDSTDKIIDATFANCPLVSRTEYDDAGYHICIDHPVKTMNVSREDALFQTDTGPLILPDLSPQRLSAAEGRFVGVFDLAYSAFNESSWAEFIVNVPTPVADGVSVNHYSKSRRIENTRNCIIEIGASA